MAFDGGHWYLRDGSPFYTTIGKNGKERSVTLRDARTAEAVPSVTGIINMQAKPFLTAYFKRQILDAAYEDKGNVDALHEDKQEWSRRIQSIADEHGQEAARIGTEKHNSLEMFFEDELPATHEDFRMCLGVKKYLSELFGDAKWVSERSFASSRGYGGKVDLLSDGIAIIDFKFKEFSDTSKGVRDLVWRDNGMQLVAYKKGLELLSHTQCTNLYIDRNTGEIKHYTWQKKEEEGLWEQFKALLTIWQLEKKYRSGWDDE